MRGKNQKTILLVEDEAIIALGEKMTLEFYGYEVIIAKSGAEAVETIEKTPSIDLILMDINLGQGKMDGTKAAEIILRKRDLPMVFLSSHTDPEIVEKTEKITSYGYVVKNSGSTVLDASIKMAFKLFESKTKEKEKEEALETERGLMLTLIDNLPDNVFIKDVRGGIILDNLAHRRILGHQKMDAVAGKSDRDFFAPALADQYMEDERGIVESGQPLINYEEPIVDSEGRPHWYLTTKVPVRDSHGNITALVGINRDITERKKVEIALRESEERFNKAFRSIPDALIISRLEDGKIIDVNNSWHKVFGYSRDEVIGKSSIALNLYADSADRQRAIASLHEKGFVRDFELQIRQKSGKLRAAILSIELLDIPDEQYILTVVHDITERKRAEQEIDNLAKFPSQNPNPVLRLSRDGLVMYANVASGALLGLWGCAVGGTAPQLWRDLVAQALTNNESKTKDIECYGKVYSMFVTPVAEAGYVNFYGRDVTERREAEARLLESEERFRTLVENSTMGLYRTTPDGRIQLANPALVRMLGYSSFDDLSIRNLEEKGFEPLYPRTQFIENIEKDGEVKGLESAWKRKDGTIIFVRESAHAIRDSQAKTIYYEGTVEDITERKRAEKEMKESENKYRLLADNVQDVIFVLDMNLKYTYVSPSVKILRGYEPAEVLIQQALETLTPSSRELAMRTLSEFMEQEKLGRGDVPLSPSLQLEMIRKDGTTVWTEVKFSFIKDENQRSVSILGVSRDIAERKQVEEAQRQAEENYRGSIEESPLGIHIVSANGETLYVNRAILNIYGYDDIEEFRSTPTEKRYTPASYAEFILRKKKRMNGEDYPAEYEISIIRKTGEIRRLHVFRKEIFWDGHQHFQTIYQDITERERAEKEMKDALQEKEALLREIHHRVKNNMQVISSLFHLQAGHTLNEDARAILKEAQLRIQAMSLVHEELYKSRHMSRIDFGKYINSLALHLFQVYGVKPDLIRLETELESMDLDIASAMPCGLLLNELISNALKYAFPGNRAGVVRIALKRGTGDLIKVLVADDGIGFPEGLDFSKAESFGLQIVNLLVGQLDATIELDRTNGTAFIVTFCEMKYPARA